MNHEEELELEEELEEEGYEDDHEEVFDDKPCNCNDCVNW